MVLIFLINLFAYLTCFFFGRFLGKISCLKFSIISSLSSFFLSLIYYFNYLQTNSIFLCNLGEWITIGNFSVSFSFLLDPISLTFSLLITFITSLILIYSFSYFYDDPNVVKFFSFLNFFAFSMLVLVMSNNYIIMFLGWESVGLASYLLINFWHTRNLANKGAIKAIIFNRFGDIFFIFSLCIIFLLFRSFDFSIISCIVPFVLLKQISFFSFSFYLIDLLAISITLAAMAKSAQFLLHPWLPDAMEGPTPVSALLHSATMVTAGLFLIIRSSFIFAFVPEIAKFISIIGLITVFISSIPGLYQYDIKRIIAYSTCSQLGFMFFSLGLRNYEATLYHLFNHAFFKALLFLCAGSVIHALNDQDIRKMGGIHKFLPLTYISMLLASLSLIGFPGFSGFESKDMLLENVFSVFHNYSYGVFSLGALSAFLTSFYSFRLIYLVFFGSPSFSQKKVNDIHEGTSAMYIPLIVLTFFSVTSGFFFNAIFVSYTHFWGSSLINLTYHGEGDLEEIPFFIQIMPNIAAFLGLVVVLIYYSFNNYYKDTIYKKYHAFFSLFNKKIMFDPFYNTFLHKTFVNSSLKFFYGVLDKGIFEKWGPHGLFSFSNKMTVYLLPFHSNFIYHILLISILFLPFYLVWIFLPSFSFLFVYASLIIIAPRKGKDKQVPNYLKSNQD